MTSQTAAPARVGMFAPQRVLQNQEAARAFLAQAEREGSGRISRQA